MKLCKILLMAVLAVGVIPAAAMDDLDALERAVAQDLLQSEGYGDSADRDAKKREEELQQKAELLIQSEKNQERRSLYKNLCTACSDGSFETVKRLVLQGADVSYDWQMYAGISSTSMEKSGRTTPLVAAIENDSEDIVKFLIEKGADIGQIISKTSPVGVSKEPTNALYIAVGKGNVPIVKLLLSHKADHEDTLGNYTVLMVAVEEGYEELVQLLLLEGADISAIPQYARLAEKHDAVKKILDKHRADGGHQLMMSLPRFSKDLVKIVAGYAGFSVQQQ